MTFRYEAAGYRGEHVPSGRCSNGCVAMIAHWKRTTGLGDDGCYNDRNIRGGSQKSLHAVGRAADLHADAHDPSDRAKAESYIQWLILNHLELGVQYLIWNRRSWRPDRGWKSYSGVDPHNLHIHAELNIDKAANPSPLWAKPGTTTPSKPPPKPKQEIDDMIVKVAESQTLWSCSAVCRRNVTQAEADLLVFNGFARYDKDGHPFVKPRAVVELLPIFGG